MSGYFEEKGLHILVAICKNDMGKINMHLDSNMSTSEILEINQNWQIYNKDLNRILREKGKN